MRHILTWILIIYYYYFFLAKGYFYFSCIIFALPSNMLPVPRAGPDLSPSTRLTTRDIGPARLFPTTNALRGILSIWENDMGLEAWVQNILSKGRANCNSEPTFTWIYSVPSLLDRHFPQISFSILWPCPILWPHINLYYYIYDDDAININKNFFSALVNLDEIFDQYCLHIANLFVHSIS